MTDEITLAAEMGRPSPNVRVWDPLVRGLHWSIVAGVATNVLVAEGGHVPHRLVGYLLLASIALRLAWGVIAPGYARFSSFVPTRSQLTVYLRQLVGFREPRYIGHNPAGAVMMLALVTFLVLCGVTGWMLTLDAFWGAEWLQGLHEGIAYAIVGLATVHVMAAVRESLRHRENLIWSMITGRKRPAVAMDVDNAPRAHRG